MSWWVGGYIEAGMSTGGSQTAYLPFVFQAANKTQAQANAGAKLLAGPFSTQSAAQDWANAYEKNPSTYHAGTDIPQGPGQPVAGGGSGPGGTGTSQGDNPPAPALTGINAIGDFFSRLTSGNTWLRLGEGLLGIILIAVGFARISHAIPAATKIAKTVGAAGVAA